MCTARHVQACVGTRDAPSPEPGSQSTGGRPGTPPAPGLTGLASWRASLSWCRWTPKPASNRSGVGCVHSKVSAAVYQASWRGLPARPGAPCFLLCALDAWLGCRRPAAPDRGARGGPPRPGSPFRVARAPAPAGSLPSVQARLSAEPAEPVPTLRPPQRPTCADPALDRLPSGWAHAPELGASATALCTPPGRRSNVLRLPCAGCPRAADGVKALSQLPAIAGVQQRPLSRPGARSCRQATDSGAGSLWQQRSG